MYVCRGRHAPLTGHEARRLISPDIRNKKVQRKLTRNAAAAVEDGNKRRIRFRLLANIAAFPLHLGDAMHPLSFTNLSAESRNSFVLGHKNTTRHDFGEQPGEGEAKKKAAAC